MNILIYLIILLMGVLIGSKNILSCGFLQKLDHFQTFALLLLLFIMGISIGMDEVVIDSFLSIGLQATVLATLSVIFSVLGVKLVSKRVLGEEKRVENDW